MFTYSAKYQIRVYRPGGECNSTIYCSNINCRSPTESRNYNPDRDQSMVGADHPGLPTSVDRRPNFCVDLLYSHRSSPVCVVNQDRTFNNH